MITFTAALFFLIITPGPGILTTAGIGAAYGYRPGAWFLLGLVFSTNIVALTVITGLAAVVFSVPWLRTVLMFLSTGYLVYLAATIAFAGTRISFVQSSRPLGFVDGALFQLSNPKAYVVNTTLFSGMNAKPENSVVLTT